MCDAPKKKFQLTIVIFYNLNEIGDCEYKFHSTTCWQYCVYTYTVKITLVRLSVFIMLRLVNQ